MGFRTVVVFNNDLAGDWGKDPLGEKILGAANRGVGSGFIDAAQGVRVVQVEHTSYTSLLLLDHLTAKDVTSDEEALRAAAERLGFSLVKKTKTKKRRAV